MSTEDAARIKATARDTEGKLDWMSFLDLVEKMPLLVAGPPESEWWSQLKTVEAELSHPPLDRQSRPWMNWAPEEYDEGYDSDSNHSDSSGTDSLDDKVRAFLKTEEVSNKLLVT